MTLPDRITKLIADAAWSRDNAAGMTLEREEVEALAGLPDLVQAMVAEEVAKEREWASGAVHSLARMLYIILSHPDTPSEAEAMYRPILNMIEQAAAAIRAGKGVKE